VLLDESECPPGNLAVALVLQRQEPKRGGRHMGGEVRPEGVRIPEIPAAGLTRAVDEHRFSFADPACDRSLVRPCHPAQPVERNQTQLVSSIS
jgi:hypothetical protein